MVDSLNDPYALAKFRALRGDSNEATADFLAKRYEHCRERFTDRFGIAMSRQDWDSLCLALFLETDDVEYLDRGDTDEASLYAVRYRGVRFLCAYLETGYAMMTVFPRSDARLIAHGRGNFIPKENGSDAALRFRRDKQLLIVPFETAHLDSAGNLAMDWPSPEPIPQSPAAPKPTSPFAALASLKQTLATEAAKPTLPAMSSPSANPKVAERFATLNRQFDAEERDIEDARSTRAERIAELERQLAEARAGDTLTEVRRTMLDAAREQARLTFEQNRDGLLSDDDALGVAAFLGRGSPATSTVVLPTKTTARKQTYKRSGWADKSRDELDEIQRKRVATMAARSAAREAEKGASNV